MAPCASSAFAAETEPAYRIQLFHPRRPDDLQRARVIVTQSIEQITKKGERELLHKTQKRRLEFTAAYNVLEIDTAGLPTHLNCTVEKAVAKIEPGPALELCKPNSILDVQIKDGKPLIQPASDLVKLSPDAQPLLAMLIVLTTAANESKLEAMLGTTESQKLKSSWKVNSAAILKELTEFDAKITEKAITGTTQFRPSRKRMTKMCWNSIMRFTPARFRRRARRPPR